MRIIFLTMGLLVVFSCGKKKEDPQMGPLNVGIHVANSGTSSSALTDPDFSDFKANSTTSGPPTSLTIYIKSMTLKDAGDTNVGGGKTIFYDEVGKPIRITGSKVDLSSLFDSFTCVDSKGRSIDMGDGSDCACGLDAKNQPILKDEQGKCPDNVSGIPPLGNVSAEVGTYGTLGVEYYVKAQAKGCVSGDYRSDGSAAVTGRHTYCTRAAHSTFSTPLGGTNADFEDQTPQEMDFSLSMNPNDLSDPTATLYEAYPIRDGIEIGGDSTATLTMVIDVNRMLRFYNQGMKDQGPNPGMPTNRSFFYTTVFDGSAFVFVGQPGDIKGFAFVTNACADQATIPADHICVDNPFVVAGWITLIFDKSGNPIVTNLMPDDDNTLTVIKGANRTADPGAGWDPSCFTVNSGGIVDLKFYLGNEGSGHIYGINTNMAVGSQESTAYFESGFHNHSYGKLILKRGL